MTVKEILSGIEYLRASAEFKKQREDYYRGLGMEKVEVWVSNKWKGYVWRWPVYSAPEKISDN